MIQTLYNYSPIFLQNLMVSLKGKQILKERYNEEYYRELDLLRSTKNEFHIQERRYKEFLKFISENSEYFKRIIGCNEKNLSLENISKLPVMSKEDIRKNLDQMVTRKSNLIEMKTGGSTGKSLTFYTHPSDIAKRVAYLDYFKEKHGVSKGMKRVSIGGRVIVPNKQKKKVFWRYNAPLNQLLFSAFHADGDNLEYYIDKLNKFKPVSIDGYTTVIHRLAIYIINNNINLDFKPKAIFPTAEALTDEMRKDIEIAFKCPVRNQYSSSEGAPFITENIHGKLEINPATGVFELNHIQDNLYELIVTSFYTTTTPLLRYKIGDTVELEEPLPKNYKPSDIKIKRIIGRNNDFLYSNERGVVTNVNLSTVIREGGKNIKSSQFIQNNLQEIIINLIVEEGTDIEALEKKLTNSLTTRFGNSTKFKFNYVDRIEKTTGGKTRFTINNIKE